MDGAARLCVKTLGGHLDGTGHPLEELGHVAGGQGVHHQHILCDLLQVGGIGVGARRAGDDIGQSLRP